MTKQQVAKWLGFKKRGIETLTARGVLPAIKIGERGVRYRRTEVEQQFKRYPTKAM